MLVLANAQHIKQVPGRKTDVSDCEWMSAVGAGLGGGRHAPTADGLQAVLQVLLEARGLNPGQEMSEARELCTVVERDAPRMHTPFNSRWFARLLQERLEGGTVSNPRPQLWEIDDSSFGVHTRATSSA
jgi:hypothetical protein